MSQMLSVLVLVFTGLVVVGLVCLVLAVPDQRASRRRRGSRRLVQQLRATDRGIARDQLSARRAMNQAAGQARRNQFE